ncbi:MAG: hypothetical protein ACJ8CR_28165 [Roseiflexaceae bacterium]
MRTEQEQQHYGLKRRLAITWRHIWPVLRQVLGWLFILLGLIGLVLPILQGVIFLVIGIALVGRRQRLIRWVSVHFKLFLRRWAALQTPLIGPLGRMALRGQQELSRQRRRLHWWYVERRRLKSQHRRLADEDTA